MMAILDVDPAESGSGAAHTPVRPSSSATPSAASASSSSSERPLTATAPATTPSMRTGKPPPNPT